MFHAATVPCLRAAAFGFMRGVQGVARGSGSSARTEALPTNLPFSSARAPFVRKKIQRKLGGQGQGLVGLGASASCPPKRSLPFYGLSELEGTVDPPG